MIYRILNVEYKRYSLEACELLKTFGIVDNMEIGKEELIKVISDYNILIVGLGNNIEKDIINHAKNLEIIATATTGIDHIDVEYANKKGIEIISLKDETEFLATITSTAEHTFGLILSLIRKIPWNFQYVKQYKWSRKNHEGLQLRGKHLGLIGFGRLGKMVAQFAQGFNMIVSAFDPYVTESEMNIYDVKKENMFNVLNNSDIISIHAPMNKETTKIMGEKAFKMIKEGCYMVNTSRGELIDEDSLINALQNGRLSGAALDVLSGENNFNSSFKKHALIEYAKANNNLIITPHIAGMAIEAVNDTRLFIVRKIIDNFHKINPKEKN